MGTLPNAHDVIPPDPLVPSTGGRVHSAVLVVGLDGSDTSWNAFSWACGQAQRLRGRLVVVFVTRDVWDAGGAVPEVSLCNYTALRDATDEQASELRIQARQRINNDDVEFSFMHARGDTAAELLRIAKAVRADQIVVGRSTRLRHRLTGALGRRLLAKRAASVVVIVP